MSPVAAWAVSASDLRPISIHFDILSLSNFLFSIDSIVYSMIYSILTIFLIIFLRIYFLEYFLDFFS